MAMRYRRLGNSDLEVSELALGSWLTFGVSVDRDRTRDCVRRAFELGINFFDTANMYGKGAAEELLGEILADYPREDYVLGTKLYFPMSKMDRGLSREQVFKQIDASLERLGTDYVDLYQCHRYDEDTPLEETMQALTEVVGMGKARYVGFSQWKPRQIKAAAKLEGMVRFVSSQPQYSMLHRRPERRVFTTCEDLGIGQIVYSPLAQGVLSGKYVPGKKPPEGSRAADERISGYSTRFDDESLLKAVRRLVPIAERLELSLPQLALAWILRDRRVTAAIIGASRPAQIEDNVGAVGVTLDEATLEEIDEALGDHVRR
jgi:aryl-alcohol dehydrogenase-like predicted oxidoreductase